MKKTVIQKLNTNFDVWMKGAKGFTIENGKKLYWYIVPNKYRNQYRCFSVEDDGTLGWPRYCKLDTKVTVHNG